MAGHGVTGRERGAVTAGVVAVLLLGGCAKSVAPPPSADGRQQAFPDIGGRTVMMLPVQSAMPLMTMPATADPAGTPMPLPEPARAALEAELAYWLPQAGARVRWVMTEAVERAVRGSPAIDVRVRDLTVRDFQRSRLQYIGDPLYTELRRVAALMDARGAFLPIGAVWIPERAGGGRVHLAAAIIDTMGGQVLWQGVVAGTPGALDDPTTVASAAQALARLVPP
jgi:hypothetical protein